MILIVTNKDDFTADYVINKLNDRGVPYFRLNCDDLVKIPLTYLSAYNSFEVGGHKSFNAVWYRRTRLPTIADPNLSAAELTNVIYEYEALLNNFIRSVDADKWLSKPDMIRAAENKTYQLNVAAKLGFNIPSTIVTNDKQQLLYFAQQHANLIIKPLKNGRIRERDYDRLIYTNKLETHHLAQIDQFDLTPCIIQEEIKKDYELRITVVGAEIFAARVNSQTDTRTQVDWRKEQLPFNPYKLPDQVERACKALVDKLGLTFGAIDMIKGTDGKYYFLEINPNGQWAWIEHDTGLQISDSIINFFTA